MSAKKYFIKVLRSPEHTYYLTFYKDSSGKECFSYKSLSIKDIKDMDAGIFKYQGTLQEMEKILKKFYAYRSKSESRVKGINEFKPTLQLISAWTKVNKVNLKN